MMQASCDLDGRAAIVTGAAQGLGLAIAETLAAHGARVALFDLQTAAVVEQARRIADEAGREMLGFACDTRDARQVAACVERAHEAFGSIDVLVNNAGIHRRGTPIDYRPADL